MVEPMTMMAVASALGGMFGGSPAAPPQSQQIFTPEMRDQMLNYLSRFGGQLNTLYGTPSVGPGGTQVQQASTQKTVDKNQAFIDYLVSEKGLTKEAAQQRLIQLQKNPDRGLRDNKGFTDWIRAGKVPGLSIGKSGGIITEKAVTPGGVQVSPQSELLNSAFQNLSAQAAQAASGLPALFGQDTARALQQKAMLSNLAMNQAGQAMSPDGITMQNQTDLDALEKMYLQKFGDIRKDSLQQTVGNLVNSGFTSSNLAAAALQEGTYDAESRFLTEAMAALAGQREGMVSGRAARESQSLANTLNSFNTLGANQGMAGVLSGIVNPNQAGLFNDTQAAQMAATLQQQNIQNNMGYAQMMQQALAQPIHMMPEAPGLFSQALGAIAPVAGFFGASKLFGNSGSGTKAS